MIDYPNMSYCMCENTLLAMRQVLRSMVDCGPSFYAGMTRQERQAYRELFMACEEFIITADEIDDESVRVAQEIV